MSLANQDFIFFIDVHLRIVKALLSCFLLALYVASLSTVPALYVPILSTGPASVFLQFQSHKGASLLYTVGHLGPKNCYETGLAIPGIFLSCCLPFGFDQFPVQ